MEESCLVYSVSFIMPSLFFAHFGEEGFGEGVHSFIYPVEVDKPALLYFLNNIFQLTKQ